MMLYYYSMIPCLDACTDKPCYDKAIPTCKNVGTDCSCIGHLEFDAAENCVGKIIFSRTSVFEEKSMCYMHEECENLLRKQL